MPYPIGPMATRMFCRAFDDAGLVHVVILDCSFLGVILATFSGITDCDRVTVTRPDICVPDYPVLDALPVLVFDDFTLLRYVHESSWSPSPTCIACWSRWVCRPQFGT